MWQASVLVLVACTTTSTSITSTSTVSPTTIDLATIEATPEVIVRSPAPIDPLPFAPDPLDDGTTAGAVRIPHPIEVAIPYTEVDVVELALEDLPAKNAAWKRRSTIPYEGYIPLMFGLENGRLRMYLVAFDGPLESVGLYRGFDLTWTNDPTVLDQLHEQHLPHIEALLHVRPTDSSPDSERVHIAVYTPPDEKVLLVATRRDTAKRWRPLLRIDAPKAEEITLHFSVPH
jgi:hypothetical protein